MIHVVAIITAKSGMREAILKEFHANMPAVHAEKGCIEYELYVDAKDDHSCYLIETWESEADLDAHKVSEHVSRILPLLGECRVAKPELLILKKPEQLSNM